MVDETTDTATPSEETPKTEQAPTTVEKTEAPTAVEKTEAPTAVEKTEMPTAVEKTEVSIVTLLEAGAHFGHQASRWDPRMRPFIFGERNGIHILDLDQTLPRFFEALGFIKDVTEGGGKVLFVGTKRQVQASIRTEAVRSGQFYVNNRWLGGMLTNFRTVKKSIDHYKELEEIVASEEKVAGLSKKEMSSINRHIQRYEKSLGGIKELNRLPDVLFVIDVGKEHIAITEARRLGIPIIAIVDSNCNPNGIEFVIPANDDAIRAVQLYCSAAADACIEGDAVHQAKLQATATEKAKTRKPEGKGEGPKTGRRVVDIKQPAGPGKGRGGKRQAGGAASGGVRKGEDMAKAEAPKAKPAKEVKAKPAAEAKAKPAEEVKAKPAAEAKAKPAKEVKAKPAAEAKAKPAAEPKKEEKAEQPEVKAEESKE